MNIACVHCKKLISPEKVFTGPISTAPKMWTKFRCLHCKEIAFFMLKGKRLEIGILDGFPGPVFVSELKVLVQNLHYQWRDRGLKVTLDTNEWLIPYK